MATLLEVASYDEAEATLEKRPKVYNNFVYDNLSDEGAIDVFEQIDAKVATIQGDIEELHSQYGQLQALYDEFTNYNETMEDIINRMNASIDTFKTRVESVITTARDQVEAHMVTDSTLISDLEALNDRLGLTDESSN